MNIPSYLYIVFTLRQQSIRKLTFFFGNYSKAYLATTTEDVVALYACVHVKACGRSIEWKRKVDVHITHGTANLAHKLSVYKQTTRSIANCELRIKRVHQRKIKKRRTNLSYIISLLIGEMLDL
jgi:hypothetical protein